MDDRFPGRIFQGTAKSIYEEMKALKPEAFVMDVTVKARSLDKRSSVGFHILVFLSINPETNISILAQL